MTTNPNVIVPQPAVPQLAAPQAGGQAPQQIFIVTQPASPRKGRVVQETYKAERSRRFGWTLITLGMLAMIFNIANMVIQGNRSYKVDNWTVYIGTGIWCGCFYLIAGGLGIGAGQHKTTSMIRGNMAMGVFGVLFGIIDMAFTITSLAVESSIEYGDSYSPDSDSDEREDDDSLYHAGTLGLSTMGMLLAITAIALCIASCELAGKVLCTGNTTTPQQTFMQTGGQMLTIPGSGQQVMVLNIPQAGQSAAGFQNNAFSPQGVPLAHTPPPSYYSEEPGQELPQKEVV